MAEKRDDATTSELRYDWLADRWVIIAPQRTERPHDFVRRVEVPKDPSGCPFCGGRESETPAAVANYLACGGSHSRASSDDWLVRVVPNKFPAVQAAVIGSAGLDLGPAGPSVSSTDLFQRRDVTGGHEVIVESPLHVPSISELDPTTTRLIFTAYRDRLRYWLNEMKVCYAVVFKNVGEDAGASLLHTHSQLIATNMLPPDISRAVDRMSEFYAKENDCLFCRMSRDELEHGARVVDQTKDFIAFCPFASRLPSLVTIVPIAHQAEFSHVSDDQLGQLSWLTQQMVKRIEHCYPQAAYNLVIHTSPSCKKRSESFHWRMEVFPRLTKVAGFEWGSDCYINPLAPEDAAHALRSARV